MIGLQDDLSISMASFCDRQMRNVKKWMHHCASTTSVVFCVSLAEYNEIEIGVSNENRLMKSIELFDTLINSRWLLKTSFILFLCKAELFESQLQNMPLNLFFPEYTGGANVKEALEYILKQFISRNRSRLRVYAQ